MPAKLAKGNSTSFLCSLLQSGTLLPSECFFGPFSAAAWPCGPKSDRLVGLTVAGDHVVGVARMKEKKLRVLIVGLGSIGRRHLSLLLDTDLVDVTCLTGQTEPDVPDNVNVINSLEQALHAEWDFAIICNPTSLHVETALSFADKGVPLLIEKPLADSMDGIGKLRAVVGRRNLPVMTCSLLNSTVG